MLNTFFRQIYSVEQIILWMVHIFCFRKSSEIPHMTNSAQEADCLALQSCTGEDSMADHTDITYC
jgi:hypothetical protein